MTNQDRKLAKRRKAIYITGLIILGVLIFNTID